MTSLSFTVLFGPWYAGEDGPYVDDVSLEGDDVSPELVRLAHHAHAAGSIRLHDVTDEALAEHGVQTQEDAEAALAGAMGEWIEPGPIAAEAGYPDGYWTGPWAEGNRLALEAATAAATAEGDE